MTTRRIVCAAVKHADGSIVCGPRHFDETMRQQMKVHGNKKWADAQQGFVDQNGLFLTRTEAWIVAREAGQIAKRVGGDGAKLYSENLY